VPLDDYKRSLLRRRMEKEECENYVAKCGERVCCGEFYGDIKYGFLF
jgi:hypothetical protein